MLEVFGDGRQPCCAPVSASWRLLAVPHPYVVCRGLDNHQMVKEVRERGATVCQTAAGGLFSALLLKTATAGCCQLLLQLLLGIYMHRFKHSIELQALSTHRSKSKRFD